MLGQNFDIKIFMLKKSQTLLLRRKRSPKTPNIPESTTFQDMHHHMRNMMTPDFSQTGIFRI